MRNSIFENYSLVIEKCKSENPLIERGLVELYFFDKIFYDYLGFKHKYKTVEEALKSINKQRNVLYYIYYDDNTKNFFISENDNVTNPFMMGLITCSKRVIRTVWHELQRANKEEVVNKAIDVMRGEVNILNKWIDSEVYNVKVLKNDIIEEDIVEEDKEGEDVVEIIPNIMAKNDEELFEKIEMLSITPTPIIKELIKNIK